MQPKTEEIEERVMADTVYMTQQQRSDIIKKLLSNMVHVSGGSFVTGDQPQKTVKVGSFMICKYELTLLEWKAITGKPHPHKDTSVSDDVDNMPVCLTMQECQTLTHALSIQTGRHFRLPSEAEWEFAARGGNMSKGYTYAGSNEIEVVAWYSSETNKLHEVGKKQPNELGLYDMSGNLAEWCDTNYNKTQSLWIVKGGNYHSTAKDCSVTSSSFDAASSYYFNGLRLVLDE